MTSPIDPELSRTVDVLASTLSPEAVALGVSATLRPPAATSAPAGAGSEREAAFRALSSGMTLPRLDVSQHETGKAPSAELELSSLLGRGGMGAVWLARQRSLARDVAVKRLHGEAWSVGEAAALLAEARATGALEHPSIVPIHALGIAPDGSPLLVMKRIEGTSLEALLRDDAHPSWPALERRHGDRILAHVEILARVCDALELAHARGFVHRDVKPENIMIGPFGETYLLDWGIALAPASLSEEERERVAIVGTPAFMAPEMAYGRASGIDARTDVYLLGATLHAVLTGNPRHDGATLHAVLLSALLSEPPVYGADVEPELAALVVRATAAAPADRPSSVAAFREALAEFRRHRGSRTLTREIEGKLRSLPSDLTPEQLASPELSRTLTEARFGLAHALSEWPENEGARLALARTLRLLARVELARGSHETAAALLAELSTPDPELAEQIDALRRARSSTDVLAARARADAVDRDPTVSGRARLIFITAITIASMAVGVGYAYLVGDDADALTESIASDGIQIGVVAVVAAVFRKRLLANRWGRRTIALILLAGTLLMLSNLTAILRGDVGENLSVRNLVFATLFATASFDTSPRLLLAAGWAGLAALICAASPSLGSLVTMGSMLSGVGVLVSEVVRPTKRD